MSNELKERVEGAIGDLLIKRYGGSPFLESLVKDISQAALAEIQPDMDAAIEALEHYSRLPYGGDAHAKLALEKLKRWKVS